MHYQTARNIDDLRYRRQIVQCFDRKFGEHIGVDRHGADVTEQKRIAIGIGFCRNLDTDIAGRA